MSEFCFSDSLESGFGAASVVLAVVVPTILGPLASLLLLVATSCVLGLARVTASSEARTEERRNLCCTALLSLVFLATYSTSMVASELYFPIPDNIFTFVLLKFIVGVSHQLLGPLAVLASQADIR